MSTLYVIVYVVACIIFILDTSMTGYVLYKTKKNSSQIDLGMKIPRLKPHFDKRIVKVMDVLLQFTILISLFLFVMQFTHPQIGIAMFISMVGILMLIPAILSVVTNYTID